MRQHISEFLERYPTLTGMAVCAPFVGLAIWILPPLPYRRILTVVGGFTGTLVFATGAISSGEWLRQQRPTAARWAGHVLLASGIGIIVVLGLAIAALAIWAMFGAPRTECSHWC